MSCNGCNSDICPNSNKNRRNVDQIIIDNIQGIDFDDKKSINSATRKITNLVKEKGLKPCIECIGIDKLINDKKQEICQNLL